MEKRIEEKLKGYFEELKTYQKEKLDKRGKGVIESYKNENATKLIEQLRDISHRQVTEQWTIVIPALTEYEVAGHLRDYVFVTDIVKGKVGKDVTVPYVKDFDFDVITPEADTLPSKSIIGTLTTTLKEAGAYSDVPYADIEKINQNLLDEINRVFAHAAVRAEDKVLVELLAALTTGQFAGDVGGTNNTESFYAKWVPDAIKTLLAAGKEVHPGDCVLYLTPNAYGSLLKELAASQIIAYARGDVITKGIIEDYLGVRIVVGGTVPEALHQATATATRALCFLFRAKRCLCLAPKRDILIETDRFIKERKLRITGSHTFGALILDGLECVRIWTKDET